MGFWSTTTARRPALYKNIFLFSLSLLLVVTSVPFRITLHASFRIQINSSFVVRVLVFKNEQ